MLHSRTSQHALCNGVGRRFQTTPSKSAALLCVARSAMRLASSRARSLPAPTLSSGAAGSHRPLLLGSRLAGRRILARMLPLPGPCGRRGLLLLYLGARVLARRDAPHPFVRSPVDVAVLVFSAFAPCRLARPPGLLSAPARRAAPFTIKLYFRKIGFSSPDKCFTFFPMLATRPRPSTCG